MQRWSWTTVVFSGSSSEPPSSAVSDKRYASSTRNRSLPSGSPKRLPERPHARLHPDRRREAAEEEAAGLQQPPRAEKHRPEMRLVAGEVEDRAADDDIRAGIREARRLRGLVAKVLRGVPRSEPRRQLADGADRLRVRIERPDVVALAEEEDEVAPAAAARLEDPHAGDDPPAQELIEKVDVDPAEEPRRVDRGREHPRPSLSAGRAGSRRCSLGNGGTSIERVGPARLPAAARLTRGGRRPLFHPELPGVRLPRGRGGVARLRSRTSGRTPRSVRRPRRRHAARAPVGAPDRPR